MAVGPSMMVSEILRASSLCRTSQSIALLMFSTSPLLHGATSLTPSYHESFHLLRDGVVVVVLSPCGEGGIKPHSAPSQPQKARRTSKPR
jgi:hypothetical protein